MEQRIGILASPKENKRIVFRFDDANIDGVYLQSIDYSGRTYGKKFPISTAEFRELLKIRGYKYHPDHPVK